jgi:hypothetical protein
MQNSLLPPPSPAFLEARYKVRRSSQAKPLISRLPGTDTWVCRLRGGFLVKGFGLTPMAAYKAWKRELNWATR